MTAAHQPPSQAPTAAGVHETAPVPAVVTHNGAGAGSSSGGAFSTDKRAEVDEFSRRLRMSFADVFFDGLRESAAEADSALRTLIVRGRPHRPNPLPKHAPAGWRAPEGQDPITAWRSHRAQAHVRQESAAEARDRRRAEAQERAAR